MTFFNCEEGVCEVGSLGLEVFFLACTSLLSFA